MQWAWHGVFEYHPVYKQEDRGCGICNWSSIDRQAQGYGKMRAHSPFLLEEALPDRRRQTRTAATPQLCSACAATLFPHAQAKRFNICKGM